VARFRTLDEADVRGKRVLVRADLNVPVENGAVTDATRIERVAPTLRELADRGAAVIVLSHFERPKGKVVPEMSLRPIAPALARAVGREVAFVPTDWRHDVALSPEPGSVTLLENTRFHPGEEANDEAFVRRLAALGDLYVNDAFSAAHRAHASTEGLAHCLPAFAGRAMEAELRALAAALTAPRRPLVAVVGGAKVSGKLEVLGNLVRLADTLVIGGAMANTFLKAQGIEVGRSLVEPDLVAVAEGILAKARAKGSEALLPVDAVVAAELKPGAPSRTVKVTEVGREDMILDVGPATVAKIAAAFDRAATLVWNGPLGAFEIPPFDAATRAAARHAAKLTRDGRLTSVAGGGDTVAALNAAGVTEAFTYVSTAGGAFLEWLEGKTLPGVAALEPADGAKQEDKRQKQ
jgi:phosphoglycerate kinase